MISKRTIPWILICLAMLPWVPTSAPAVPPVVGDYTAIPPFISAGSPPLLMLVMGRDESLFNAAYNNASDLDGDGVIETRFKPNIDYYGYFDCYKCYMYNDGYPRFEPIRATTDKTCGGDGEWSGNFLNYLTMTRLDCLRKVLYGGWRKADTTTDTTLERAYVPQDNHAWGTEYSDPTTDGYDIKLYTPYSAPTTGKRHLFANSSQFDFASGSYQPLLRIMTNNTNRIWNWVAKERPVVDSSLIQGTSRYEGYPDNNNDFLTLIGQVANTTHKCTGAGNGTVAPPIQLEGGFVGTAGLIHCAPANCNPYQANPDNYYLGIITGTLTVPAGQNGIYWFSVDGDDAVEVLIDGNVVAGYYGPHAVCNCNDYNGSITLAAGDHVFEYHIQQREGQDAFKLNWVPKVAYGLAAAPPLASYTGVPAYNAVGPVAGLKSLKYTTYSTQNFGTGINDYAVRVRVGVSSMPETNCKQYPNASWKPVGILQKLGEPNSMYFGLITGSYAKNTSGGVLRKNIGTINDEIDPNTGVLTSVNGIMKTLNTFRIVGFEYSGFTYNQNCGWIATRPINEGECRMWGNPIGEMMYEGMRYYAGAAAPTPEFTYSGTTDDGTLGLPLPTWKNPYNATTGFPPCSQPFMMVISDINPSYDMDQLPGSKFKKSDGSTFNGSTLGTLNVATLADQIGQNEGLSGNFFVGQSSVTPTPNGNADTTCSPKAFNGLSQIRGLCPEQPTKQGGYYSAAVALYGHNNDLNPTAAGSQKVTTYAVALASPLPRIEFTIQGRKISLVPFAKSPGGCYVSGPTQGGFQPTDAMVGFFIDTITSTYGKFRVSYGDIEQGGDNDMDSIAVYEYQLYKGADVAVTDPTQATYVRVKMTSEYAAGCIIQHMGYIISGTTHDGTYLEVRDVDTGAGSDVDYFMDTPSDILYPGDPGFTSNHMATTGALRLNSNRRFDPRPAGGAATAQLLQNPLFYVAKYGGFIDNNGTGLPDDPSKWDKDNDGLPDTYFYVVNPLKMEQQLNQSFASILQRTSSGTAASVISGSRTGEGAMYQALFYPQLTDAAGNTLSWSGQVYGLFVDHYGNFREDTNQNGILDLTTDRIVQFFFDTVDNKTKVYFYNDTNGDGLPDGSPVIGQLSDVKPIWDGSKWLAAASATATRGYNDLAKARHIWTWVDLNNDGLVSDGGLPSSVGGSGYETVMFDPETSSVRNELSPYLMARAVLTTNLGTGRDLEYTAVTPGLNGGKVTITYANPGAASKPLTVSVSGNDITVSLETDTLSQIASTANEVCQAVNTNTTANVLVTASLIENDKGQSVVTALAKTQLSLDNGVKKLMRYTTGQDQQNWRKRQIQVGTSVQTWKLGDIIYSTPAVSGQPAEDFDLIYGDSSYFNFRRAYANRRQVLYIGSNDGILHAFNGGFWNATTRQFATTQSNYQVTFNAATKLYDIQYALPQVNRTAWDLGTEMWAFIPQGILPHLQWQKDPQYPHVYTVDLKPKITDIRFSDGSWHTILICGMRLGGKDISATDDFNYDGTVATSPAETRTFHSEYFALDVTDPESPPKLLWSFTSTDMGLTTTYPTVVRVKDKWFVIVGSGPRGAQAFGGVADQNGRIFVLNAQTGTMATTSPFIVAENVSFMADPVAVDVDLQPTVVGDWYNWSSEIVYVGTTSGSPGAWTGAMHRLVTTNSTTGLPDDNPNNWTMSTFFVTPGPISAAVNATRDNAGNLWVYFGTGRFWSGADKNECQATCAASPTGAACTTCQSNSRQWFYGIKEPVIQSGADAGKFSWATVTRTNLVDTSNYTVYEGGYVDTNGDGVYDYNITDFIGSIMATHSGWMVQFPDVGERCSYQAVVLGGIVTFTTYVPSLDVCAYEGTSYLWALYYLTGTGFANSVIGTGSQSIPQGGHNVLTRISLGTGVGTAPSIHIGANAKVMVQSSTGAVISTTEQLANTYKSGPKAWREEY